MLGGIGTLFAALFNGVVHRLPVTIAVLALGFAIGLVLGLIEFFVFDRRLRRWPFISFLLLKSGIFALTIYALMAVVSLLDVVRGVFSAEDYRNLSTTMGHSTGLIREQCPVW